MLLERAAGLAEKVGQYGKLKAAANEAELFRTRADQVGKAAAQLAEARAALERFRAAGVPVDFYPVNGAELSGRAASLRETVTKNPAVLADPPFNLKYELTDRLRGLATAANGAIEQGWRAYATANGRGGGEDVLSALAELPQMRAGVARIRQFRQRMGALAASIPADPAAAVAQLKALAAEHRAAWAELTADGIPPTVIRFLQACSLHGASLEALTPDILTWLAARNLLGSFRIRIGLAQ